jgi:hypothetical protein
MCKNYEVEYIFHHEACYGLVIFYVVEAQKSLENSHCQVRLAWLGWIYIDETSSIGPGEHLTPLINKSQSCGPNNDTFYSLDTLICTWNKTTSN